MATHGATAAPPGSDRTGRSATYVSRRVNPPRRRGLGPFLVILGTNTEVSLRTSDGNDNRNG